MVTARPPSFSAPCASLCAAALLLGATPARAQRGEGFVPQAPSPGSPLSGFPGLFDAHTVERGRVSVSLPTTSIDVGATDNLSVGTYAIPLLVNLGGVPTFALRLRYRFFSTGRIVSVLDATGGFLWSSSSDEAEPQVRFTVALFANNTALHLGERQILTLSLLVGRLSMGVEDRSEMLPTDAQIDALGLLVGLSYQANLARWLSLRAGVFTVPIVQGVVDSTSASVTARSNDPRTILDRSFVRALVGLRLGNWLLEGGAFASADLGSAIPWLSLGKIW